MSAHLKEAERMKREAESRKNASPGSALEAYRAEFECINLILSAIHSGLVDHDNAIPKKDWSHVGDMTRFRKGLSNIRDMILQEGEYEPADG